MINCIELIRQLNEELVEILPNGYFVYHEATNIGASISVWTDDLTEIELWNSEDTYLEQFESEQDMIHFLRNVLGKRLAPIVRVKGFLNSILFKEEENNEF